MKNKSQQEQKCTISKKTKKEQKQQKAMQSLLDADECMKPYDNDLDQLVSLFQSRGDRTQSIVYGNKREEAINRIKNMTLSDLKSPSFLFALGPVVNYGDFNKGDICHEILSVRRSPGGLLVAKVSWKKRQNGEIPLSTEIPTYLIADKAPQKLIRYYKSKILVKTM